MHDIDREKHLSIIMNLKESRKISKNPYFDKVPTEEVMIDLENSELKKLAQIEEKKVDQEDYMAY